MEPWAETGLRRQFRRQSLWLRDSYLWLLRTKVLAGPKGPQFCTALDVGCGFGFVMDIVKELCQVRGVDVEEDMVRACRARSLRVERASAYRLPYRDCSFDVVYCTFLLLWLKQPLAALEEMTRVSKQNVLCLAEPDLGGRIDYPDEIAGLGPIIAQGMSARGADPFIGRKLRELCEQCGLDAEVGVHPGVWSIPRLHMEFDDEWGFVESSASAATDELAHLKKTCETALRKRSLFQYNPIFYALGHKR